MFDENFDENVKSDPIDIPAIEKKFGIKNLSKILAGKYSCWAEFPIDLNIVNLLPNNVAEACAFRVTRITPF